jgi:hypothetical protein
MHHRPSSIYPRAIQMAQGHTNPSLLFEDLSPSSGQSFDCDFKDAYAERRDYTIVVEGWTIVESPSRDQSPGQDEDRSGRLPS